MITHHGRYLMQNFLRSAILLTTLVCVPSVHAMGGEFMLNTVHLQFNAQKWLTTQTALVSVSVNTTVQSDGIDKAQASVMDHLKKLSANGEWHLLSLDRNEDKSGLETIQIHAQARLQQSELADLRDKAKLISTPGEAFKIDAIEFKPGDEDLRAAMKDLRADIYNQAKIEIDALNKMYPDQKYYLHSVNFMSAATPMPVNAMYMKSGAMAAPAAPPLSIGNKQELAAEVVIGSLADASKKGFSAGL